MTDNSAKGEWIDPDDAPELDDEWFARAELRIGDRVIRPGNPPLRSPEAVTLRLDPAVVARFRAAGPDWERRMADALAKAAGL